jgi:hypothetical protein
MITLVQRPPRVGRAAIKMLRPSCRGAMAVTRVPAGDPLIPSGEAVRLSNQ